MDELERILDQNIAYSKLLNKLSNLLEFLTFYRPPPPLSDKISKAKVNKVLLNKIFVALTVYLKN